VTDPSGTYTRSYFACFDLATARWTAWNPVVVTSAGECVEVFNGWVYLGGGFSSVGGLSRLRLARVSVSTGAVDSGWTGDLNGQPSNMRAVGSDLFICGSATTFNGVSIGSGPLKLDSTGGRVAFVVKDTTGQAILNSNGTDTVDVLEYGTSIIRVGGGYLQPPSRAVSGREILRVNATTGIATPEPFGNTFNARGVGGTVRGISSNLVVVANLDTAVPWVDQSTEFPGSTAYTRSGVIKLNSSLSLDTSFTVTITGGQRRVLSRGASDYIAGNFTVVNGVSRAKVALLGPTGGLDSTFAPVITGTVETRALAMYGNYLLMGMSDVCTVNGVAQSRFFAIHRDTGVLR